MLPKARRIAKELLKEHEVPTLEREVVRRGELVLKEHDREKRSKSGSEGVHIRSRSNKRDIR
jgi:hypothetical protein